MSSENGVSWGINRLIEKLVDTDESIGMRTCHWCKKTVEGKGWKDGPNIYCGFNCFSAKSFKQMLGLAIFLTPVIALYVLLQDIMVGYFLTPGLDPFIGWTAYFILLLLSITVLAWMYRSAYVGWRINREIL